MVVPTTIWRVSFNLSWTDNTVTSVTCTRWMGNPLNFLSRSPVNWKEFVPAALPAIGSKIIPTNSLLISPDEVKPSMDSTSHSAVTATNYQRMSTHILWQGNNNIQLRLRQKARLSSINSTAVFLLPLPSLRIQRVPVVTLIVRLDHGRTTASSGKGMMSRLDRCQPAPEGS